MIQRCARIVAVWISLAALAPADDGGIQPPSGDAKLMEGLWSGSWGGGARGGVVFQPVLAEAVSAGNHIELAGFRNAGRLAGTFRIDSASRRMRIVPAALGETRPAPKPVEFSYAIKGDSLTLT